MEMQGGTWRTEGGGDKALVAAAVVLKQTSTILPVP
jgi:hypothetical protein